MRRFCVGLLALFGFLSAPPAVAQGSACLLVVAAPDGSGAAPAPCIQPRPIDLSFLNHDIAGDRGRVRADGPRLVYEDGTEARFWGVNIQANALFRTEQALVRHHAKRLAALGVNLARIHHHDSAWVRSNIFGEAAASTLSLDQAAMERLDWWIAALKDEGIYIWLDIHVGREFSAADDVRYFDEMPKQDRRGVIRADLRGYNYVNPDIQAKMRDTQTAYLTHRNRYTGLRYADDPAVMAVLITNENDLTRHFGNRLLANKNVPGHNALFRAAADAFAARTGLDNGAIRETWEHGPSKYFLNDLEAAYFAEEIQAIRDLGYDGLIATTNFWGGMSLAGLPSLTLGDLIDVHMYGRTGALTKSPVDSVDMEHVMASGHVVGMPLTVSEWNIDGFPSADRFVPPLRMAAMAAFQSWDAMMLYGYAQQAVTANNRPGNWHAANDYGLLSTFPAAALMYRQGHVAPAQTQYTVDLSAEALFDRDLTAGTARAIRTLAEQAGLTVALPETPVLPWLTPRPAPAGAERVTDVDRNYLEDGETVITSDTGEIARDFAAGVFTVDTGQTQLVAGALADRTVTLSNATATLSGGLGAVAVQSLDDQPIERATDLMVTIAAAATPVDNSALPFVSETVSGTLTFAGANGLRIAERPAYLAPQQLTLTASGDRHILEFRDVPAATWLRLSVE